MGSAGWRPGRRRRQCRILFWNGNICDGRELPANRDGLQPKDPAIGGKVHLLSSNSAMQKILAEKARILFWTPKPRAENPFRKSKGSASSLLPPPAADRKST